MAVGRRRSLAAWPLAALATLVLAASPVAWLWPATGRGGRVRRRAGGAEGVQLQLVTNRMCPFAQKAWVALEESGLPFSLTEISLYGYDGKPDWFMKLNPKGEIPVLVRSNGGAVVDSERILDWVAQAAPDMAPEDASAGAAFRRCVSGRVAPTGKSRVLRGSSGAGDDLDVALGELNEFLEASPGDFAAGGRFSVADAAAVPFIQRLDERYGLPERAMALQRWWRLVRERPGVAGTLQRSWWWWW
mmetsp:Transcript_125381/g.390359  ORF Transcript_125381/g.390359 Transcript_125381/m.390359 type:complete len:246 (+) Transcript_125381:72-809(+)